MISIITPTVRHEGLGLVDRALRRQGHTDYEWIIGSPDMPQNLKTPFVWVKDPKLDAGDIWSLNKCYNAMIEQSKGDLIVSWQDYTFTNPDTLDKFWFHYQNEPKTIVTAVGNKYQDDSWTVMTWKDPRERDDQGSFYQCFWNDIEGNLCSIPKQAVYDVGGFCNDMDKYYGLDFFNVLNRLNDIGGYDFKIDQSIKSYSLEHGRLNGESWDEDNWMAQNRYNHLVTRLKEAGRWPNVGCITPLNNPL